MPATILLVTLTKRGESKNTFNVVLETRRKMQCQYLAEFAVKNEI